MNLISQDSLFYHIYPLGFCGCPPKNDFISVPVPRLEKLYDWSAHLQNLGINALYLGPVFESTAHGYDTADYFNVDRRLGDNNMLKEIISHLHAKGISVILDGVFNHTGRDFWAFRDLQNNRENSAFKDWFADINFASTSPLGDPFSYQGWNGHYDLVKLNLKNSDVKAHLLAAVRMWILELGIDGLRLDAADCVDMDFMRELSSFTKSIRNDFFLLGEVIHGNYCDWVNPRMLDSVTNYECYKGLFSSLNDNNYFEIAYSLKRQFGPHGIYKTMPLYSFADNHDVNRIASTLRNKQHLYPLYCMLFTMPGIPSVYYGSEWAVEGIKQNGSDSQLRPCLEFNSAGTDQARSLQAAVARLISLRHSSDALKYGEYEEVYVSHEQFAFMRRSGKETLLIILNSADTQVALDIKSEKCPEGNWIDILNGGEQFGTNKAILSLKLWPSWARVLKLIQ